MGKISQLESKLQNLIAAGEVIESIANVVKELTENALDAGSSQIDITLEEAGMKRIQVSDNGSGMDKSDAKMAFLRHATSKIKTEYDLFHITSLGFRGEALPSIAAVSRVELTTCDGVNEGIKVAVEDNIMKSTEPIGAGRGTTVNVTRLFYHTPARFKYLKSLKAELQKTVDLISKFALANPEVGFSLKNNDRMLLKTYGNANPLDVIASIYGVDTAKSMLHFTRKNRDYRLDCYLSHPLETRSTRREIHLFANKRPITDPQIQNTIIEAYGQSLPIKRFPVVVLKIEVDPQLIDVNVHPGKLQVRFSEYESLKNIIHQGVREALKGQSVIESYPIPEPAPYRERTVESEPVLSIKDQVSLFNDTATIASQPYPELAYIGQYHGTYLLFQNVDGLFLMDQHAAAERIRYERYRGKIGSSQAATYKLLLPIRLLSSAVDIAMVDQEITLKLHHLGVELNIIAGQLEVTGVPDWFPKGHEGEFVETMLQNIIENRQADQQELLDEIAILLSCKHSLKANAFVSAENAIALLRDLSLTENPYTCPHGRPIFVKLAHADLDKLFKRT